MLGDCRMAWAARHEKGAKRLARPCISC
jgi:hypothetical protein